MVTLTCRHSSCTSCIRFLQWELLFWFVLVSWIEVREWRRVFGERDKILKWTIKYTRWQLTSINLFSNVYYLWENTMKMIGKTWDNPGWIILNNPGIIRVGKHKLFRSFSPAEYLLKTFRKMERDQQHIPMGNVVSLAPPIWQIFQPIFLHVTRSD